MQIQKILYVDSDKAYAQQCLETLINYGHEVKYTSSIKEALVECMHSVPHIIIFDHELEDGNGFLLLEKVKGLGIECKSILLSNTFSKYIMREALKLKIDSYIEKEENFSTLNSQILTLGKHFNASQMTSEKSTLDLGNNFLYMKDSYHILHQSDTISLTVQEKKLLDQLINTPDDFISSEQLQYSIGKDDPVSIDTIRTVVRKIRKKTYNGLIINKSGHGYRINLQKPAKNKPATQKKLNRSTDKTALIIKGNKKQNNQLSFYLDKLGLKNETAYTIEQANKILGFISFDYIVFDIDLPDGEGVEILHNWKDKVDAKFIVLSDSSEVYYREYLFQNGIVDFIVENDSLEYLAEDIYHSIIKIETSPFNSNVLVIENSIKVFKQIQNLLTPRSYHVDYINRCDNAVEMIKNNDYDLVIVDKDIKGSMSFISIVKEEINETLPLIVLGDPTKVSEQTRESFRHGADDCICKPIMAETFILKTDRFIVQSKTIKSLKSQKSLFKTYKSVLDETSIISKTDPDGVITYVNELFCKLSGYSKKELVGQTHNVLRHPETSEKTYKELWETIKDKKDTWHGIVKNKKKDGKEFILNTYIIPKLNSDGSIKEFISLRQNLENREDRAS